MTGQDVRPVSDDRLLNGRVLIRQPRRGYRVAIDAVLLAAAVPAHNGEKVAELGCGVGASSLCLLSRVPEARVAGLELQRELFELAQWNRLANGREANFDVWPGSVVELPATFDEGAFDHGFFNPPYLSGEKNSRAPEGEQKLLATHEGPVSLGEWVIAAHKLLRPKGTLTVIHRADRLGDLLEVLTPSFGDIRVFPLWPKAGVPAKRVLVQGRKSSRAPLQLCAGLVLHNIDGDFTNAAESILRDGVGLEIR